MSDPVERARSDDLTRTQDRLPAEGAIRARRGFLKSSLGLAACIAPWGGVAPSAEAGASQGSRSAPQAGGYAHALDVARLAAGVTGASFAYWDGKQLHQAVSGLRNSVTRDPVTLDTVMHTGSITKVMTTTLLMQLVDEGRIALDDPVLKHLPELRLRDMQALSRMSCAMLVNHTSGINGEWLAEFGPDEERIVDTISRCADLDQLFAPGDAASYCNVALVIAGYLAQKLRGKSWYTLMRSHIYEPLGMEHALVDPLDVPRFRASVGDLTDPVTGKRFQTTRPFLAPSFAPAGSTQMTTASDLVNFARTFCAAGVGANGKRILSAASAKRMVEPTSAFVAVASPVTQVGLGWMILPGGVLNHGGGGPGVQSQLFAHPVSGRALALLTNCDKGDAMRLSFLEPIVETWTGISRSKLQPFKHSANTQPYLGTYENNADRYVVSAADGGIALHWHDKINTYDNSGEENPPTLLYPVGDDTFAEKTGKSTGDIVAVRFVRPGSDGRMRFMANEDRLLPRA